jgi:hypothetical protein
MFHAEMRCLFGEFLFRLDSDDVTDSTNAKIASESTPSATVEYSAREGNAELNRRSRLKSTVKLHPSLAHHCSNPGQEWQLAGKASHAMQQRVAGITTDVRSVC